MSGQSLLDARRRQSCGRCDVAYLCRAFARSSQLFVVVRTVGAVQIGPVAASGTSTPLFLPASSLILCTSKSALDRWSGQCPSTSTLTPPLLLQFLDLRTVGAVRSQVCVGHLHVDAAAVAAVHRGFSLHEQVSSC